MRRSVVVGSAGSSVRGEPLALRRARSRCRGGGVERATVGMDCEARRLVPGGRIDDGEIHLVVADVASQTHLSFTTGVWITPAS